MLLTINNLHVTLQKKNILNGINLKIQAGEVHAIMGPNGSGKSTLGNILTGKKGYNIIKGDVFLEKQNILELNPSQRAHAGIFLSFQNPIEIPGVTNAEFLKHSINSINKYNNKNPLDSKTFLKKLRDTMDYLEIDHKFLKRSVNDGFSGGEKKRNEILQMMMLEPKLCILDEIDSGLDIDALKLVSKAVNYMHSKNRAFIIITHYQRILNYIEPDFVHVLVNGQIIKVGNYLLASELEQKGYSWIKKE